MSVDALMHELSGARRRLNIQNVQVQQTKDSIALAVKDKMPALEAVLRARLPRYEKSAAVSAAVVKELETKLGELDLKKR